jgi:hypothetical protein
MDKIIKNLFISKKDTTIDSNKYNFIGKGGTGVVYKVTNLNETNSKPIAIKIIPKQKFNPNEYKIGIYLNSLLNGTSINFIKMLDKTEYEEYIVLKMELVDTSLVEWSKQFHSDKEWVLCILQILINLHILQQKINLFHRDMKPKNILVKKFEKEINFKYELNSKEYEINTDTIFYITDFAHSHCDLNQTNFITNYDTTDNDLHEIRNIPQRLKVDKLTKLYKNKNDLIKIANKSKYFKGYYEEEKKKINILLKSYPDFIKDKHLTRNICYFILENNLINIDISNIMSTVVEKIFSSILDEDISTTIDKLYNILEDML